MRVAVVGPFAVRVGVMHEQTESRTFTRCRPLQHLEIAVGVAESGDGAAADEPVNSDRFALFVIDEIDFR